MAQTRRRRRRKHRGTQSGSIDRRPRRGRPQSREEARARARAGRSGKKRGGPREPSPPTWRSAVTKGLIAAGIFFVLIGLLSHQALLPSLSLTVFMLAFYIPLSFYTDGFFYRRRMRRLEQERIERSQRAGGHANGSG